MDSSEKLLAKLCLECGQHFLMEVTVMSEADEMRLDCISEALMVALFYGSCFTAPWSGAKLVPEQRELEAAVLTLESCV